MAEPLWTSAEIARAVGGGEQGAAFDVTGVTFDSRGVEPGDLFVAMAGVRDGHEFVDAAMAQIRDRTGTVDTLDVAILTALNLARELLALRENAREVEPAPVETERMRALIERVEWVLAEARPAAERPPLLTLPAGRELDEVADDLLAPLLDEAGAGASSLAR